MSAKWNLIVDVARCDNCRNCFLATKDEHIGNDFPGYAAPQPEKLHSWVDILRHERGSYPLAEAHFMPVMCNHCDDAPCIRAAKDGAVRKREDGIVIIDPVKAKGQKQIVEACPYGAVWWNEELELPQHWIFDAHLLDSGWSVPRVQQSCPTDVFRALKIEDAEMARLQAEEGLEVWHPEYGTKPRVYYKNLHLITQCFIAGAVAVEIDGVEECAAGAEAVLTLDGQEIGRATADAFGEFKIDKLPPNSGPYRLEIRLDGAAPLTETVALGEASVTLETLRLAAAAD